MFITPKIYNNKIYNLTIDNFANGLIDNNSSLGNEENSLLIAKNVIFNRKLKPIKRYTLKQLGNDIPSNDLILGVGYNEYGLSSNSYKYFRIKKDSFQGIGSLLTGDWVTLGLVNNFSTLPTSDYYDIISFKTVGTEIINGTISKVEDRYIQTLGGMNINEYIGKILDLGNGELKYITSNTEDTIFIEGLIENKNAINFSIKDYRDCVYVIGFGDIYKYDGNIFTKINNGLNNIRGIVANNRLYILTENAGKYSVIFSELNFGDHFSKYNTITLKNKGKGTGIKNIHNKIIVYFENSRVEIYGDSPENIQINYILTHKGAISGGSISNGNNTQFFLSNQGIEMLSAIDNYTIREGLSISDIIKNKVLSHGTLSRSHGVVFDDKYFLNIVGETFIFDINRSLETGRNIFTTAYFEEASQNGYFPGEWTCSKDCGGTMIFGQGGCTYYIRQQDVIDNKSYKNISSILETQEINLKNTTLKKLIREIKIRFIKTERQTNFKIYISYDGGGYILLKDTYDNEIKIIQNKICNYFKIKIEISQNGDEINKSIWEFDYMNIKYEIIKNSEVF